MPVMMRMPMMMTLVPDTTIQMKTGENGHDDDPSPRYDYSNENR